jgi:hypothetical protein
MRSIEALNLDESPLFFKNWRKTKKLRKIDDFDKYRIFTNHLYTIYMRITNLVIYRSLKYSIDFNKSKTQKIITILIIKEKKERKI